MIKLLEDMEIDETSEAAAVEIAAQGVTRKRVDEMKYGFIMVLAYMIPTAEKDGNGKERFAKLLLGEVRGGTVPFSPYYRQHLNDSRSWLFAPRGSCKGNPWFL